MSKPEAKKTMKDHTQSVRHDENNSTPDWACRKSYVEDTEGLDNDQWRWEFLRRDPDYRRAWGRRCGEPDIDSANAAWFDLPYFIDPALKAKQLDKKPSFLRTEEGSQLHDLRCAITQPFSKRGQQALDNEFFASHIRSILCDKERAVFVFDITKPLAPQIDRAETALDTLQQKCRDQIEQQLKRHGKSMPRRGAYEDLPEICMRDIPPKLDHLRVLDARNQDVSFTCIGEVIYEVEGYDAAAIRGSREYAYAKQFWKMI